MARRRQRGGGPGEDRAVYVISIAAELAGVHPQTLRIYERKGLLQPSRTSGNSRRYSQRDVEVLRRIQQLTQDEGVNLAGVRIIMELEHRLERIEAQLERTLRHAAEAERQLHLERELHLARGGALARLSDVRDVLGALSARARGERTPSPGTR